MVTDTQTHTHTQTDYYNPPPTLGLITVTIGQIKENDMKIIITLWSIIGQCSLLTDFVSHKLSTYHNVCIVFHPKHKKILID